jgi:hypothetical protein
MNVNSAVGFSTPVPAKQRSAMRDWTVLFPAIGMLFGATGAASTGGRRRTRRDRFPTEILCCPHKKAEPARLRVGGETRATHGAEIRASILRAPSRAGSSTRRVDAR